MTETTSAAYMARVDSILKGLHSRDYIDSIALIDALENDASADGGTCAVTLNCAELRLDAALLTKQPISVCENLYRRFLENGPSATDQLLKSVILARDIDGDIRRIVVSHVAPAIERAKKAAAPPTLLMQAEELLARFSVRL